MAHEGDGRISGGREPWDTPAPPPGDPSTSIRNDSNPIEAPLIFHLDDAILVDVRRVPIAIAAGAPITVFDQLLTIVSPMPGTPHVSAPLLDLNYVAAEVYVFRDGGGERDLARLIDHDGKLHDLREERVTGTLGKTPGVGARAAVEGDHPTLDFSANGHPRMTAGGCFELHLIDTLVDDFLYNKKHVRLFHLVVYSSAFVIADDGNVANVLANLDGVAQRWNPGHPSSGTPGPKSYAIAPLGGAKDGGPLVLLRHFLGHRSKQIFGKLVIHVKDPAVRANFSSATKVMTLAPADVAPGTASLEDLILNTLPTSSSDSDGTTYVFFAMAHEFGHVCSSPTSTPSRSPTRLSRSLLKM